MLTNGLDLEQGITVIRYFSRWYQILSKTTTKIQKVLEQSLLSAFHAQDKLNRNQSSKLDCNHIWSLSTTLKNLQICIALPQSLNTWIIVSRLQHDINHYRSWHVVSCYHWSLKLQYDVSKIWVLIGWEIYLLKIITRLSTCATHGSYQLQYRTIRDLWAIRCTCLMYYLLFE